MRIKAFTCRIIRQLYHDKRTTCLILIAPILVLSLMYFILNGEDTDYTIGVISAPEQFVQELKKIDHIKVINLNDSDKEQAVKKETVMASVQVSEDAKEVVVYLDGSNVAYAQKVQSIIKSTAFTVSGNTIKESLLKRNIAVTDSNIQTNYIYGKENLSMFGQFGTSLIGVMVYFFSFLIAGINFLGERSTGTLEKLMSTPVRRGEIIIGYVLGFSLLALIQTTIISWYTIYILKLEVAGNIGYVFLINLLTAIAALTLGIALSVFAKSEFQMIQFIPIVIIPQIFLSGLFDLSGIWSTISYFIPLHYTSDALKEVILKGNGWGTIWKDAVVLIVFSVITVMCNIRYLKRQRAV